MSEFAIIVAGGSGSRMKSDIPKQYLPLEGLPVLMHTINAFYQYSNTIKIILVLPEHDFDFWKELCSRHQYNIPHTIVAGGKSRFQSVKKGISEISSSGMVAIHDGVRPLVHKEIIAASFQIAQIHGCAVASVRLKESLRKADQDTTKSVDRSKYRLIQTPQTFRNEIILQAYELDESPHMTDDASVAEAAGNKISLFEGSYENIKITTPEDLWIAEAIMKNRNKKTQ